MLQKSFKIKVSIFNFNNYIILTLQDNLTNIRTINIIETNNKQSMHTNYTFASFFLQKTVQKDNKNTK